MGRHKGQLSDRDRERLITTRKWLEFVFVNDKESEYGVRELERITGLHHQTISKFLNGDHNEIAQRGQIGWKWQQPRARDLPQPELQKELKRFYDENMKRERIFTGN